MNSPTTRTPLKRWLASSKTRTGKIAALLVSALLLGQMGKATYGHGMVNGLADRTVAMTAQMDRTAQLVSPPCRAETVSYRAQAVRPWLVACQGEHVLYDFSFDDTSQNCIRVLGSITSHTNNRPTPPSDQTPLTEAELAHIGVTTLKTLKMLPAGSMIALDSAPQLAPASKQWRLRWAVLPPTKTVYYITMRIDVQTRLPVWVHDTRY